ncbi:hypothetical protein Tco_0808869 [Tanacetum coccineum]
MLLMEAKEKGTVLDAEAKAFLANVECTAPYDQPLAITTTNMFEVSHEEAYDSDLDEGPHAAAAFMANLLSTSGTNGATTSQVNEVHTYANQIFDNVNHLLTHEMHQEEHLDSDVESDIDDNTIPYHQYQLDSEVQDVPTEVSFAPPGEISMITILDDLRTQLDRHIKVNQEQSLVNDSLRAELARCNQEMVSLEHNKVKHDLDQTIIQRNKWNAELEEENVLLKSKLSQNVESINSLKNESKKKELSREQVYWLPAEELATQKSNPPKPVTPFVRTRPGKRVNFTFALQGLNSWIPAFAHRIIDELDTEYERCVLCCEQEPGKILKDQLQGKDDTIKNLQTQINIREMLMIEGDLKRPYEELSKINAYSRSTFTAQKIECLNLLGECLNWSKTELSGKKSSSGIKQPLEKPNVLAFRAVYKSVKTNWRPTGKVVGSVKPQWKPTGRHFALYDNCPLTRIMEPIVEPLELTPSVSSSSKVTMISRFTDCKLSDRKAGSKGISVEILIVCKSTDIWFREQQAYGNLVQYSYCMECFDPIIAKCRCDLIPVMVYG